MAEKQESEKKELCLEINAFNKPLETSGPNAWARQISNLLFMTPGVMPTDPEMTIYIQQYQFSFIDDIKDSLQQIILDKTRTYFPEIPLESVEITTQESSTGPILLVVLEFEYSDDNNIAVVAAEKKDSILNFDVVT